VPTSQLVGVAGVPEVCREDSIITDSMCGVSGTGQGSLQRCIWNARPNDKAKGYSIDPKRSASCEPVAIATKSSISLLSVLLVVAIYRIKVSGRASSSRQTKRVSVVDGSFTPSDYRCRIWPSAKEDPCWDQPDPQLCPLLSQPAV
jgi:hypothetical protein